MVWFRLEKKGGQLNRNPSQKPIKKFKKGEPDWDYFGGGMYSNYFSEPQNRSMRAYEIFPTLKSDQSSFHPIPTDSPRSFELYKHVDNDYVQLAIRSTIDDIEHFAKSLSVDYSDTGMPVLPIISKDALSKKPLCFFFDFELEHQFNFSAIDTQQKPIIDNLIRAMNVKGCAILIQFLFTTSIKWNSIASATAANLSRFLQKIDTGKTQHVITGLTRNFVPIFSTRTMPDVKGRSSSTYAIGKKIEKHYHRKATSAPISSSIRGMIIGNQVDISLALQNIASVFAGVIFSNDFLRYCDYHVDPNLAYNWLVNNEIVSKEAIQTLEKNQTMWSDIRWGIGRDFVPFLCLTSDELAVFVSLPTDTTLPIRFTRQKIKAKNYEKMVFPLGSANLTASCELKFGRTVNSLRENVAGIGPEDLSRHVYILGSTGSGKSTLIKNLYKHLELANQTGTLANSSIYIDVKDNDAKFFLRQCEKTSIDDDLITYLDINKTNFGINLLELPKYEEKDRDMIVSRTVGHVMEMFKEFYTQQQTFVQLERILRLLLHYLYSNTDTPTLLDLYEIIVRLQRDGKAELLQISRYYKNVTGPEMKTALDSISSLSKDSWISLLNRIEPFATDNYLKQRFSVKCTTIDFEKMMTPGNTTIFRISETETPKHVHGITIMAIVIKIWFAILDRASKIEQEKRTLVVLALDEFQRIKDLSVLTLILSHARIYDLGLIISHQNLAQIETELLETIVGNTGSQIYGRVSGIDASKIARIIDPHFSSELTDQITAQPDFIFTAKTRPAHRQEQSLPVQFKAMFPPPLIMNENETEIFVEKMRSCYSVNEIMQSELHSEENKAHEWAKQLYAEFRTKEEWQILIFLYKKNTNLKKLVEGINSINRNKTSQLMQKLYVDGVVNIERLKKYGCLVENQYALSPKARRLYFPQTFRLIGTAADIDEVATKAFQYYIDKQMFVSLANQDRRNNKKMCDMVVYDYENEIAISVEIESIQQVGSHPEQVRLNMIKWKNLGFTECHVWSKSRKINEIKEKLGKEAEKVQTFTV